MLPLLAVAKSFLLPQGASSYSPEMDWLFYFVTWITIIFSLIIFLGTAWLVIKFRYKKGVNDIGRGPTHSNLLEIVWSVIPLIIVLVIAVWGFQGYMTFAVLPPPNDGDTLEIGVEAYQWGWRFVYPNGHIEPTLHVPVNTKVRLVESSTDVIHSLYLPEFRYKRDAVPGRFNKGWFMATEVSPMGLDLSHKKPDGSFEDLSWNDVSSFAFDATLLDRHDPETGKSLPPDPQTVEKAKSGFDIECTEYCGTGHSRMLSKVYVHPDMASYKKWLDILSNPYNPIGGVEPAAKDVGLALVKGNGCLGCHNLDGTRGTGPTWKDMFGNPVKFADGGHLDAVDENYVRESILYPQAKIVETYGGAMPTYLGKFSDRDLTAIITYMKSISSGYHGAPDELTKPVPMQNMDKAKTK